MAQSVLVMLTQFSRIVRYVNVKCDQGFADRLGSTLTCFDSKALFPRARFSSKCHALNYTVGANTIAALRVLQNRKNDGQIALNKP